MGWVIIFSIIIISWINFVLYSVDNTFDLNTDNRSFLVIHSLLLSICCIIDILYSSPILGIISLFCIYSITKLINKFIKKNGMVLLLKIRPYLQYMIDIIMIFFIQYGLYYIYVNITGI